MIDTHCHIHDDDFSLDADEVLNQAFATGLSGLICIGTNAKFSDQAIKFAQNHENVWATVGLHPHDASQANQMEQLAELAKSDKVVAVGECGLDYFYDNSPRDQQKAVLVEHFKIASENNLPMSFHIRGKEPDSNDAYNDFWEIYDQYSLPGVVHSFSAHTTQLKQILERKLLVGVNGLATFMKPGEQLSAIKSIPLKNMVLETDSPLLTPVPYRGKINEPKYISIISEFLSELRNETTRDINQQTSANARSLFGI